MKTAREWITELNLKAHPEGGYYKQTDYSEVTYSDNNKELPLYTNIYFLLTPESPSHFHELTSDELWFYHAGSPPDCSLPASRWQLYENCFRLKYWSKITS